MNSNHHKIVGLVIKAILAESKKDPGNPFVQLPLTNANHLTEFEIGVIQTFLISLQPKEILRLDQICYPEGDPGQTYHDYIASDTKHIYFEVELLDNFKEWANAYLNKQKIWKDKLAAYEPNLLTALYKFCQEINGQYLLTSSPKILLEDLSSAMLPRPSKEGLDESRLRQEGIDFAERHRFAIFLLKNWIITAYDYPGDGKLELWLDIHLWNVFYRDLNQLHKKLSHRKPIKRTKTPKDEGMPHKITLTPNDEVLINGLHFSKPHSGNENAEVIRYLIANPNRPITRKELKEHLPCGLGKDLRKIVENLGFSGEYLKAFFRIVKNESILLRNPVTQQELKQLGINSLPIRVAKSPIKGRK